MTETKIFVSYRRGDSGGATELLAKSLTAQFGAASVFRDIGKIIPGDDFPTRIEESLTNATVVLAVIGPNWRGAAGWWRRARVRQKGDWVRRELEIASGLPAAVIPVLVNGAGPPRASQLPPSLNYLGHLQAISLRTDRWDDDVAALLRGIEDAHVGARSGVDERIAARTTRNRAALRRSRWRNALLGLLLVVGVISAIVFGPQKRPIGAVLVDESPASDATLDIGFWNLRRFGKPMGIDDKLGTVTSPVEDARVERIVDELARLDLDLYGLIEVDRTALDPLVEKLAAIGIQVGIVYEDTPLTMDLAVLYRRDRVQCQRDDEIYLAHAARLNEKDPASGKLVFPRKPLFVNCDSARLKSTILVTVVHFKSMYGGIEATRNQRQLASIVIGEIVAGQHRVVVGGDFNSRPEEAIKVFDGLAKVGGLVRLFGSDLEPATWIGGGGLQSAPLDYIWASPDLSIKAVDGGAYAVVALDRRYGDYVKEVSDHLPLVISLKWDQPPP